MDQVFVQLVDQIALSGAKGTALSVAAATVTSNPRPAFLSYLRTQLCARPSLFTLTSTPTDTHVVAHPNLRRRSLGFSPLEHPPLPDPAWLILEALGKAGPSGLLQADLGNVCALPGKMVHHYICLLAARRLIARRKVVLQRPKSGPFSVTTTSIIVLARYAAQISHHDRATERTTDILLERVLAALRSPPYIRSERDLKAIAIPSDSCPPDTSLEVFSRRRHRTYRSLRTKLIRLGFAVVTTRKCVSRSGRPLGNHPCLRISDAERAKLVGDRSAPQPAQPHQLQTPHHDHFVAEVDLVEQVYRILVNAGPKGISVPEMRDYLDKHGVIPVRGKRIRTVINTISKFQPTVERQHFEGSAMCLRISLQGDNEAVEKRRKIGLTSLGERRQEILMELLRERRVLILEILGREIARIEDGAIARVDPKVMRRLVADLVAQKRVKMITATRPSVKETQRYQTLVLVALPEIEERGDEVKRLVRYVVNRSLYGVPDEDLDQRTAPTMKVDQSTVVEENAEDDDESLGMTPKKTTKSAEIVKNSNADFDMEHDDNPVVMYQATDGNNSSDEGGSSVAGSEAEDNANANVKQTERTASGNLSISGTNLKQGTNHSLTTPKKRPRPPPEKKDRSTTELKEASKKSNVQIEADGKQSSTYPVDEAILIEANQRDMKGSRISRLRAADHGCLKGKFARIRRFHKDVYRIVGSHARTLLDQVSDSEYCTVEAAGEVPPLAKFSFLSVLREMTVGDYAASVGIYMDHGDIVERIRNEKICDVIDDMHEEMTSHTASRQVQSFVQTLSKLELVRSDVDSRWLLSGAGIIRDFGRGLPSGVLPHGVIFANPDALDAYWVELEQFSRCSLARRPLKLDLRKDEGVKEGWTHAMADIYFPTRWALGLHRLSEKEQIAYETLLQRLIGVQISVDVGRKLDIDNFIKTQLPRFDVEQLDAEMGRALGDELRKYKLSQPSRKLFTVERLVMYSRYRTKNPIPIWFLQKFQKKVAAEPNAIYRKEGLQGKSRTLQLTRDAAAIKGREVRARMPSVFIANSKKHYNIRVRKKAKELVQRASVDWKSLIPLLKAIMRTRAIAYYSNDAEGLDWKIVPSLARFEMSRCGSDSVEPVQSSCVRRAVVSICDCVAVRAALDILSLKLVLKLRELSKEGRKEAVPSEVFVLSACNIVNEWKNIDETCLAIVMEVRQEVKHSTGISIRLDSSPNVEDTEQQRDFLKKQLGISGLRYGRLRSFSHMAVVTASRLRRVADLRFGDSSRHVVLLSQPYGDPSGSDEKAVSRFTATSSEAMEAKSRKAVPLAVEMAELAICCVVRQPGYAQWQASCVDLLSQFREQDLAEARDRLLIRGAISLHWEETEVNCYLYPCKDGRTENKFPFLHKSKRKQDGWRAQLREMESGWLEDSHVWRGVCSNSDGSALGMWFAATRTFFASSGLSLVPDFVDSGGSDGDELEDEDADEMDKNGEDGDDGEDGERDDNDKTGADQAMLDDELNAGNNVEGAQYKKTEERRTEIENIEGKNDKNGMRKRIKLRFDCREGIDGKLVSKEETGDIRQETKVMSKELKSMCTKVEHEVESSGGNGIWLSDLLQVMGISSDEADAESRADMESKAESEEGLAAALDWLIEEKAIRRLAVETDETEWELTTGILYISTRYAGKATTAWRTPNGTVDEKLLARVATDVLGRVTRTPGSSAQQVVHEVCQNHTTVPRRAVGDLLFALDGGPLHSDAVVWRGGWQVLTARPRFVDTLAIATWRRRAQVSYSTSPLNAGSVLASGILSRMCMRLL